MTSRTRIAALATVTVAALTLAACGNEPEPKPTPTQESSPLEALLRDYLGDWSNEDVTRQLVAMEDLVATCMAEQGFDYTPVDYAAMGLDLTGETLGLEWGSKEFAEQYGYGITTNPVLGEDAEQPEDPNAEYVAGMTPTEQEAYYTALYGVHYAEMSDPRAVAEAGWDWRDLGCTGSAQNEVLSGDAAQQDQFAALQQEMTLMMEAASAMHWAISCSTRTTAAVISPSGGCAHAASKRASAGAGGTSAMPSTSPAHPAATSTTTANVAAAAQRRAIVIDVPPGVQHRPRADASGGMPGTGGTRSGLSRPWTRADARPHWGRRTATQEGWVRSGPDRRDHCLLYTSDAAD